jgi:hypothetical protein
LKLFAAALLASMMLPTAASNGMTDEEKKAAFLKAREEMQTVEVPTPANSATPKPKPAAHKRTPTPTPTPGRKHTQKPAEQQPESTPTPAHTATPQATPSHTAPPRHEQTPAETHAKPSQTPAPTATPAPRSTPSPTPAPTPPPGTTTVDSAHPQIVIKKGGYDVPEPPPPPEPHGWWPWSRPTNYKYLTRSVIEAIRKAPVARGRWRYIVVHNSGTRQGNAKVFDYYHRHTRKMPNGLAYHFVIGNGSSSGDGQIEIGDRWRRQIQGGHVHSDYLNNIALGICLVGDFNRDQPTKKQLEALDELIRYLRQRCGKFEGRVAIVKAHKEINPVPTDCPGDRFPYSWLHRNYD